MSEKGTVYFFTGLAGAGKTTIGGLFYQKLKARKPNVFLADGDQTRSIFGRSGYSTQARADLSRYSDAGRISGYAKDAMSWANALGLINGLDDGRLSPGGGATRAQFAVILQRFYSNTVES